MTARELKNLFHEELKFLYLEREADFIFYTFSRKILHKERFEVNKNLDIPLKNSETHTFKEYLAELKLGKPYQHILGEAGFFGLQFFVDENVLIPRPETEELLELALEKMRTKYSGTEQIRILEIGTGSGIIPIILKKHFLTAEIFSVDISGEALKIASLNAARNNVDISFRQSDYLKMEPEGKFDVIISNPPYIAQHERSKISDSVKNFEPMEALFSPSPDPLIFYRKIARDAEISLNNGGMIFLEINQKYGPETLELFQTFKVSELKKDISGNDRLIFVEK